MGDGPVLYERDGEVGVITLNRPERLNAINGSLLHSLIEKIDAAREDDHAMAVVLTGAGRAFCAGDDLKETSSGKSFEKWEREVNGLQEVQRRVMSLGKPLLAAVRGYAVGGGCEFAMMALARRIALRSPLALKPSRAAIKRGLHSTFEQALESEAGDLLTCVRAQDYKNRVANRLAEMTGAQRQVPL